MSVEPTCLEMESCYLNKQPAVHYWITSAEDDWRVAQHLFDKGDYSYSLFFGHLTIEKYLKAIYVDRVEEIPSSYASPAFTG